MNAEYLLDAIGLLDDDLIQEAEGYRRKQPDVRRWMGLAASFAVVIALGYGAIHLWPVGSNSAAGNSGAANNQGAPSSSAAGGNTLPPAGGIEQGGEDLEQNGELDSLAPTSPDSPSSPEEQDNCAALMVDGVLYWSTGEAVPVEVEESAIYVVTGYTSGVPEMDGQTNFSQDLSARYARIDMGLVVLMDGEWILFDSAPPWER